VDRSLRSGYAPSVVSPRPATVVEELWRDLAPRLSDPTVPMSVKELRGALVDLRGARRDARADELAGLFSMIGLVCVRLRDFADALDAHRNAARYEPASANHPANAAAVLLLLKRFQQALDTLRDASTRPHKSPGFEFIMWLNMSQAHHGLGDAAQARLSFEHAIRHADAASYVDLFKLANQAAILGAEDDAVEFFARYVTLAQRGKRGETPAVEVIREAPAGLKARLADLPLLADAIERATARWDAPIPDEHQLAAEIHLSPEAWAKVADLVEQPPAPSEALRRLGHAARP
jgi:tetratricopeptide (TPR) repeat protein